jgi:simple sugar transport system ATP-binding protein
MNDKAIECRNITKCYGSVEALKGVSFELEQKDDILALAGDNGAGKSTLIKILRGVLKPTSGELFVNGINARFSSPRDANRAGLLSVYQESALCDNLSVAENFFMGQEIVRSVARVMEIVNLKEQERRAKKYLGSRGFDLDVQRKVAAFSGGQRRAVAILRALYAKPKILLLDEPTAGLSVKGKEMMFDLFRGVRDVVPMILVSHSPDDVVSICDRVLVLRLGEPSFYGNVDEIDKDRLVTYY